MTYVVKEFDNAKDFEDFLNTTSSVAYTSIVTGSGERFTTSIEGETEFLELVSHGTRGDKYYVVAYRHKEVNV